VAALGKIFGELEAELAARPAYEYLGHGAPP